MRDRLGLKPFCTDVHKRIQISNLYSYNDYDEGFNILNFRIRMHSINMLPCTNIVVSFQRKQVVKGILKWTMDPVLNSQECILISATSVLLSFVFSIWVLVLCLNFFVYQSGNTFYLSPLPPSLPSSHLLFGFWKVDSYLILCCILPMSKDFLLLNTHILTFYVKWQIHEI